MSLQGFLDGKFEKPATAPYYVFLNPESFSRTSTNAYDSSQPAGVGGETPRFINASEGPLSFSLLLDGTRAIDGNTIEVSAEIKKLKDLAFDYQGAEHSPYFVQVSWGTLLFKGRLTTFTVNYSMFRPDGTPLRAKVDLAFVSYTDPADLALQANNQSADLSHRYLVRAGDTLPQLCFRIYGSAQYYLQVARHNRLVHVSRLVPGTVLHFPPLVLSSSTTGQPGLAGYAASTHSPVVRPGHVLGHGGRPAIGWHPDDYDYEGYQSPQ
jgi:hypothetical protein